ncbi:hypothetical protein IFR05_004631 [Cadophora sp. M221]|nr:hypothetical protein IFR05_004631 [Cadophora sp. M221]
MEYHLRSLHECDLVEPALSYSSTHHPIYHLVAEAGARFEEIKNRQSKSLAEAVMEYKRRYGRPPPPGFDDWYRFAVENKVQLIDEYDYMTNSLEPYWKMPARVLKEYVDQALSLDNTRLNTLTVKNKEAKLSGGSFQHAQLVKLIQPIVHLLPDFKAPLNEPDEPRILTPHDSVYSDASYVAGHPDVQAQPITFSTQHQQIVWNSITLPCAPNSLARSSLIPRPTSSKIPFVINITQSQDLCLHPATFSTQHGYLSSPSTFSYTPNLVPILSTAKLSTFSDIMIPSSYYFQSDISSYDETSDVQWDQKKDIVYWRGSGTGGHWTHGSWKMGHRQRFVNFTNTPSAPISLLRKAGDGKTDGEQWSEYQTTMAELKDKFLVKFSGFIQCDDEDCKAEEDFFGKAEKDKNNDANAYKILYNLDGNSFSGRYYRFLKSNSLIFMQALFKEWHDDRILPWVHFVPISVGMEELGETARYFLDDEEGKRVAETLAMESKTWARKTLREVDLTAAYFRVFLEYTRLLNDERDSMVCCSV